MKNTNKIIGLLGKNISYSFSEKYFKKKINNLELSNITYKIFDVKNLNQIESLFQIKNLVGLNVTIPYKEKIIPFLDSLNNDSKEIRAVNCIHILNNKLIGYNTDIIGFEYSFKPLLKNHHKRAIILGNGGAAKAVAYVLRKLKIEYLIFSRSGKYNFKSLTKDFFNQYFIWIQTTPVGTFPNIDDILPIPTCFFNSNHLVYDLIYNPKETKLLKEAKKRGSITKNGLDMLYKQADISWNIWNTSINKFI